AAVLRRRGLLHANVRPQLHRWGAENHPRHDAQSLSLAIHRLGLEASTLPRAAREHDHARATHAHRHGAARGHDVRTLSSTLSSRGRPRSRQSGAPCAHTAWTPASAGATKVAGLKYVVVPA